MASITPAVSPPTTTTIPPTTSTPPTPSPPDLNALLPPPPRENLTTSYILSEIISHIDLLAPAFPNTNIPLLKSHLWDIKNKNVEPVSHLRGFLKVFEKTRVYRNAYKELDEATKKSLDIFINGGGEKDVLAASLGAKDDFVLPPSPAVKSHFKQMIEGIEEVLHIGKKDDGHGKGVKGVFNHVLGHKESSTGATNEMMSGNNQTHSDGPRGVHGALHELVGKDKVIGEKKELPKIWEDEGMTRSMEVYHNTPFHNWGLSQFSTPLYTFIPRTVLGLSNLVKYASTNHLRIRCSGYRHSWSPIFSEDRQILVSLLNLEQVTKIPDALSLNKQEGVKIDSVGSESVDGHEFLGIELVGSMGKEVAEGEVKINGLIKAKEGKQLARVGVAVTNEQFRRWAVRGDKWTLPVDVILVEVTIGGVNGPICHGAGRENGTVNDFVRAVEYIDCNGVPRLITSPAHLKAAAGHFGLLGIVTHITFELNPMTYAILSPTKPDIALAIPPLSLHDIPTALYRTWTKDQYAKALTDFETRARDDYYSEWFWFTRSQQAWVNTWNHVTSPAGAVEYPSPFSTFIQWVSGWLGQVITSNPIFSAFPGRWQTALLSTMGMINLPPFEFVGFNQDAGTKTDIVKCALPNALHFRRGIQNMRVRDLELQIPIPGKLNPKTGSEEPDFDIVRRAWWDIIKLTYEEDDSPMRLTLEMRIMGGSEIIMAPQRGNRWGTCSIEVISTMDSMDDGVWVPFCQKVVDLWMGYKDKDGVELNVRPHWAKEWEQIKMHNLPARQYMKEVSYKDAIPEFKSVLSSIGKTQNWELKDIQARFSNELWDYMIYS